MTLIELVENVATKTGLPKTEVKEVLKTSFETITANVLDGRDMRIAGFGRFRCKDIKGGQRKIAGQVYDVVARKTLKFTPYR